MFQDFKFNTNAGEDKIEFNQPQSATLGFGYSLSKTF